MNETIPWNREAFLQIKPRAHFIWASQQSMWSLAAAIELNDGPAVIFQSDIDGPWGAIGLLTLDNAPARTAEAWAIQSRAMIRNLIYFDMECRDCLEHYGPGYELVQCHVRKGWKTSRTWVENLGFVQANCVRLLGAPEVLVRYEWRPELCR